MLPIGHAVRAQANKADAAPSQAAVPMIDTPPRFPVQLRAEVGIAVQVLVRDNNVDQALRALKKKMQREGVFREMKLRRNYEKPSEKRARERAESVRRYRKLLRKRMEREGY
jgi:small subunit ribosomal protein S21